MQFHRPRPKPTTTSLLIPLLILPHLTSAINLDCSHILVNQATFNFNELGGHHSVSWLQPQPPSTYNHTFTIDLCKPLKRTPGVPKQEECPFETRICDIQHEIDYTGEVTEKPIRVVPIAGQYTTTTGRELHPVWTRLSDLPSHADSEKEGLQLEVEGGVYEERKQKAIIEFVCLRPEAKQLRREEEGNEEGDGEDGGDDKGGKDLDRSQEEVDDGKGGKLKFLKYEQEQEYGVLRMKWDTKYACEDAAVGGGEKKSGGWGFFSWAFMILFLGLIAYILFSAWLNYSRYGARGWDLLPHGDTIRDVPYIMQDWVRKVVDTISGSHSRGGYSAV